MSGALQRVAKSPASLVIGPVSGVTVEHELGKAAGQKMIGHQLGGVRVVLNDTGEVQVRPPEAEVHSGLVLPLDEFRQFIPGAKPRQDAVALPSPRHDLLAREVGRQGPGMLQSVFLNPAMQPVIIPAQGNQDALMFGAPVRTPACL